MLDKTARSVAYHKAYSRALYRLRDRYSALFERILTEEYRELGYEFEENEEPGNCEVCGEPARCRRRCSRCYAYERRTGQRRPPEVVAAFKERKQR